MGLQYSLCPLHQRPIPCITMYNCVTTIKLTQTLSTAYWIAFGPHGPRAVDPPGTGARVAWGVFIGLAASVALFGAVRVVAKPAPYTMTQEYQEETNEFLKNQKSDPFTGITSPGYAGKGMVQSPPKGN
ncbi:hypothetical protein LB505_004971 [Fusarium chuoi]|nr:hypothetical protein LB505_004971 [Fusarium chuoi]